MSVAAWRGSALRVPCRACGAPEGTYCRLDDGRHGAVQYCQERVADLLALLAAEDEDT